MKEIDILNAMRNRSLSDKTKNDLKNIMNIEVGERDILEILDEIKEKWGYLEAFDKKIISESIAGKYYSPKFQASMEF